MTDMIASPCVNICQLDETGRWCMGCGRSLSEIANWSSRTDTQKRAIIQQLSERLKYLRNKKDEAAEVRGSADVGSGSPTGPRDLWSAPPRSPA